MLQNFRILVSVAYRTIGIGGAQRKQRHRITGIFDRVNFDIYLFDNGKLHTRLYEWYKIEEYIYGYIYLKIPNFSFYFLMGKSCHRGFYLVLFIY